MSSEVVQLSDVVIPEVYRSYSAINTIPRATLWESGIINRSGLLDTIARSGGRNSILPFWKDLDDSIEPNYSNDDPEDIATPHSISTGTMNTRKAFMNQGFSEMDLVQELAGASPMQRIRDRFGAYWDGVYNRRLSAILRGIFAANVSKNSSDMVLDATLLTGADAVFGSTNFIDAAFTMGESVGNLRAILVHSMIMALMVKQGDIEYIPSQNGSLLIPTYKGLRVIMTNNAEFVTGTGTARKFLSVMLGAGSIGFGEVGGTAFAVGEGRPKVEVEVEHNARTGNGGGQETLWERKTNIMHPYGFNWTDPTGGDALVEFSPTLADLRKAVPWTRVVGRESIPIAFLQSYAVEQA